MSENDEIRPEMPDDGDRPITRLHIPYDMIIDPDRPKKREKEKTPLIIAVRWWCVGAAWLLVFSGTLFMLRARPLGFNIFVYMKGFTQNPVWDSFYMRLGQFSLAGAALVGLAESAYLFVRQKRVYMSLVFPFAAAVILLAISLFF